MGKGRRSNPQAIYDTPNKVKRVQPANISIILGGRCRMSAMRRGVVYREEGGLRVVGQGQARSALPTHDVA